MALPSSIRDREKQKFIESTLGNVAVRVVPVDASGVPTDTVSIASPTILVGGTKDVTAHGTAEALGTTTTIKSIYIKANSANTQNIYVGGATVDSSNGITLGANDSLSIDISDLVTVYIDSDVDGEGVGFTYFA